MKKCPIQTIKNWFRSLLPRFTDRGQRLAAIVAELDAHALRSWREGHHLFFVLILTVTIELRRFLAAVVARDFEAANRHLDRASLLMIGSGAAMRIAGDINQASYLSTVVPSMMKAHKKFSGSDSDDHAALVDTYKAVGPVARDLPQELVPAYRRFVDAVQTALRAHTSVCAKHGGDDRPSTGSGGGTALTGVETLGRIGAARLRLLTGAKANKCPFHNSSTPTQ